MLVQVVGDPGTGDRSLVHPDVEPMGTAHRPHGAHRRLGEHPELGDLLDGEVGVVGHVPVRDQHEVAGVVRVQVEHCVGDLPALYDQAFVVVHLRDAAERAVDLIRALGLVLALDVDDPVRSPEAIECVRLPHARLELSHAATVVVDHLRRTPARPHPP